ncbi:hypothetical protein BHY_1422 (plasmid) [Borrelia nietonii YOR]|uniref:Uncharacterized protein n=1 Tax=Borrelia nietonii YOR TaxID=1293576 RepID=W5SCK2_9SPIR|nr:hypothetical protein BHY_1422 [Borrelia nietonii YOR]
MLSTAVKYFPISLFLVSALIPTASDIMPPNDTKASKTLYLN